MTEQENSVQKFLDREDEDESVRKWKESLLGDAAGGDLSLASPKDDPRLVIAKEFKVVIHGGNTYTYNLEDKDQLNDLKKNGYVLKGGQTFHYEVTILVHHDIVLGITFETKAKKMLAKQEASFEIGSYPPTIAPITKALDECEVPVGKMTRGEYKVVNTIKDERDNKYFTFDSKFKIEKA
ncbi:rho GDP-dissociation inhibitor 1 [Histomonas meleagridis]|uniref:rho GDP-dissociation inhibitor 1 n=1 Tax=Histomonas meleagridis TaxID=135588 RepID=UPI00355A8527|nr:rho GDP-dissociation inhibitor 1 [Histomonas meleagridis]KAH0802305.1 rho GDP-dissociation inhibitor 1 [Histomonas meleagridis]